MLKKSRRTDVEDLTPNPRKLLQIGTELRKLNKVISDLTPVSELPLTARPRSRKEKNKLASRWQIHTHPVLRHQMARMFRCNYAQLHSVWRFKKKGLQCSFCQDVDLWDVCHVSQCPLFYKPRSTFLLCIPKLLSSVVFCRACRLKKKAQYEANKVKLWGLSTEYGGLLMTLIPNQRGIVLCLMLICVLCFVSPCRSAAVCDQHHQGGDRGPSGGLFSASNQHDWHSGSSHPGDTRWESFTASESPETDILFCQWLKYLR